MSGNVQSFGFRNKFLESELKLTSGVRINKQIISRACSLVSVLRMKDKPSYEVGYCYETFASEVYQVVVLYPDFVIYGYGCPIRAHGK